MRKRIRVLPVVVIVLSTVLATGQSHTNAAEKKWTRIPSPFSSAFGLATIECASPTLCVLGGRGYSGSGGLAVTRDGGKTWTITAPPALPSTYHTISFPSPSVGYVLKSQGGEGQYGSFQTLLKTEDGGGTWKAPFVAGYEEVGIAPPSNQALTSNPNPPMVFPTPDRGFIVGKILREFGGQTIVVYRSKDGGRTFDALTLEDVNRLGWSYEVSDLACATASDCYITAESKDGPNDAFWEAALFYTKDGGERWQVSDLDNLAPWALKLGEMACPKQDVCFAVAAEAHEQFTLAPGVLDGVIRTSDGGQTWKWVRTPTRGLGFGGGYKLLDIACSSPETCHAVGQRGLIIGTQNGGDSWQLEVPAGSGLATTDLNSISCPSDDLCFAVSSGEIFRYGGANETSNPGPPGPSEPPPSSAPPTTQPTSSSTASSAPGVAGRAVALAASSKKAAYGSDIQLTGQLSSDVPPCEGPSKNVDIAQRRLGSEAYERIGSATTDASGSFEFVAPAEASSEYIATVAAEPNCAGATSTPLSITVAALVKAKASDTSVRRGSPATIRGSVDPRHPRTTVGLERKSGRRWRGIDVVKLSPGSRFRFSFKATWKSVAFFRVVWLGGDDDHAVGRSKRIAIRAR